MNVNKSMKRLHNGLQHIAVVKQLKHNVRNTHILAEPVEICSVLTLHNIE